MLVPTVSRNKCFAKNQSMIAWVFWCKPPDARNILQEPFGKISRTDFSEINFRFSPNSHVTPYGLLLKCISVTMTDEFLVLPSGQMTGQASPSMLTWEKHLRLWFLLRIFLSTHLPMGKHAEGVNPTYVDASVTHSTHSHAIYCNVSLTKLVVAALLGVSTAACGTTRS